MGAAKPIATVLGVHPTERSSGTGRAMPVVATMNAANGRTMIVTADTTHRWDLPNRALGRDNPYVRFWGQAVRWLASEEVKRDDKPGVTAYTDKGEYSPTDEVRLLALVRDQQGQATGEASVTVQIMSPSTSGSASTAAAFAPRGRAGTRPSSRPGSAMNGWGNSRR